MSALEHIKQKHTLSGGHCGLYMPDLIKLTGKPYSELRNELNALYKDKKIKVRPGSKGDLIMLNKPKMKMSEFKGTKGPWKVIDHSWSDSSIEANGKTIAEISIYDEATEENQAELEDEMMYNFLLMSKAPEMLDELKHLVKALKAVNSMGATRPIIENAENLIKEATTI